MTEFVRCPAVFRLNGEDLRCEQEAGHHRLPYRSGFVHMVDVVDDDREVGGQLEWEDYMGGERERS